MCAIDKDESHSAPVGNLRPRVIAGFGRSGTTWVQDVLAESNGLRPVFEPLHPHHSKEARPFAHRYYAAQDTETQLYRLLDCYFFGSCHSLWTDYRIVSGKLLPQKGDLTSLEGLRHLLRVNLRARDNFLRFHKFRRRNERIVKFIRANMMLSWIGRQFDARIVFVIRHPAAVVLSQLRAKRHWDPYAKIARYQADEKLQKVLDANTKSVLSKKLDRIEAYALSWSIENSVALRQCEESNIPIIFYEDLVRGGRPEWQRILDALDLRIMPDNGLIAQPSQQAWGDRATSAASVRRFSYWTEKMEPETLNKIQAMLDATGISVYRTSEVLPVVDALE